MSGEVPHATQPNGPPKPPPPKPEAADSANHAREAVEKATAFAKTKYGDKLDYQTPPVHYNDPKRYTADMTSVKDLPPRGSWSVSFRLSRKNFGSGLNDTPGNLVEATPDERGDITTRVFIVATDGAVKEGEPMRLPLGFIHGAKRSP
jgi:hypothetical protein